jgi:hypothetical protein
LSAVGEPTTITAAQPVEEPIATPPARRSPAWALWLFVPGVVAAFVTRFALSWDGSYFLVDLLDQGHPVMLHRRPTMMLFQVPAWLGSLVTSNTRVLGFLFTLPYVLMPLAALALSWLVVRHTRPALIVWPALGIGIVTLPGQAFFVSESVIAAQFVWPFVLALITGYRWNRWAFGALLAFLFLLHPMTSLVLGTAAVVGFVVGWQRPADRSWAWRQSWILLGVAVVRQALTSAGVDSEVPKRSDIVAQWGHAVNGVPLAVVLLTTIGAAVLLIGWRRRDAPGGARTSSAALVSWAGMLLLVAAGGLLIGWGSSTRAWWQALDYRSFVLVFALPLVLWSVLDGMLPRGPGALTASDRSSAAEPVRRSLAPPTAAFVVGFSGLVFSAVLIGQSVGWHHLVTRMDRAVARSPQACVLESTLPERHNALAHWATPALALLEEGRTPAKVVVHESAACQRLAVKGSLSVPRTAKLRKPVRHWFDFGRVRSLIALQLAQAPPTSQP